MHIAVCNGHVEIVKVFLMNGVCKDSRTGGKDEDFVLMTARQMAECLLKQSLRRNDGKAKNYKAILELL